VKRLNPLAVAGVTVIAVLALLVPWLDVRDPLAMDVAHRLAPPSVTHWLGQDQYGRDVLSRLLWGGRVSLFVAISSAGMAALVGSVLGLVGGFLGKLAELLTVRSMDVVLCFPPLLLALLAVTLLGPGAGTLIPLLAVLFLPGFVRVVYAGVLAVRAADHVEAMRALGAGRLRIMLVTILPQVAGPVLVQLSLTAAAAIVLESGLSFLGLGVVPPASSWGLMIAAGRTTMAQAPLQLLWPCLALSVTILAMNALCDTLRDAMDPARAPAGRRGAWKWAALAPVRPAAPGCVLDLRDLTIEIDTPFGPIQPVRDVSLSVGAGETLAIVGESGSGKSLTGLAVMGLLPPAARVVAGAAFVAGQDVLRLDEVALRRLRGRVMAMVFQDPLSSLNPVHRIGAQIVEGLLAHHRLSFRAARTRAVALLRRVGIADPERRFTAFPHELSGGMRQRAVIAMSLANDPRLLVADEPTTALDMTIQAQVLDLLARMQREAGLAMIFITHSLPVVADIADRVAVMYAGEVVEQGAVGDIFAQPLHPYTAALITSAPAEDGRLPEGIPGIVPAPYDLPAGCLFAARCAYKIGSCETTRPPLQEVAPGRFTRCLRWQAMAQDRSAEARACAS
jgi:peptide/nickel transport system permease protein